MGTGSRASAFVGTPDHERHHEQKRNDRNDEQRHVITRVAHPVGEAARGNDTGARAAADREEAEPVIVLRRGLTLLRDHHRVHKESPDEPQQSDERQRDEGSLSSASRMNPAAAAAGALPHRTGTVSTLRPRRCDRAR